ncbi:2'-5' RNA ligase family protein [Nocardia sp. CC201C]|uniref:2'-5' RNA ligase family protein n=1 Tax=Nocardia sp. CC201C TaxID=3044575 RepID=UPI0024A7DD46|nr:2'-5' RNA ligase family protein [Nocardia sp. CC201C]
MTTPVDIVEPTTAEPGGPPTGWRGPILPVNTPSGDGREFTLVGDSVPHRPLPLPLMAQAALDDGHRGGVVIGLITRLWVQDGAVWGEGSFDLVDPIAADWAGRMARGVAGWVSADLSDIAVTEVPLDADGNEVPAEVYTAWLTAEPVPGQPPEPSPVVDWLYRFDRWKLMSATLVSTPAFEGAQIAPAADVALTAAAEPGTSPADDEGGSDGGKPQHTGAMVALVPAAEDAARLALDGGEPVDELHLTLAYLGEAAEWTPEQTDAVRMAISELAPSGPVLGEVWGHALFNPDTDGKQPCAVYLVGADGLTDLRQAVLGALLDTGGPVPEQHDPFVPHVTAGYELGVDQLSATGPIRFDRLRVAFAGSNDDIALEPVTAALTAAAVVYDHRDFLVPEPDEVTALTITDDGRVFGHLAEYDSCHIGFDICVSPPVSASGYAYFHQGEIRTDTGPLAVGKITLGTGHASLHASARAAAEHYDNTGSAVAVVRCRDGALGPWLSGRILPGISDERVDELRRSGISGDWRGVRRGSSDIELVAVLGVNVPGFPVLRRALAAAGVRSLVAAGVRRRPAAAVPRVHLATLLHRRRVTSAATRMRALRADTVARRIAQLKKERRVRTPEGAKKYGKPIGSPIGGGRTDKPDEEPEPRSRAGGLSSMPEIRRLFDLDDDELFTTLQAGFDGEYGRGQDGHPPLRLAMIQAETEESTTGRRMVHAYGQILDHEGNPVGRMQRTFYLERDGEVHVEHALLKLDEPVRGRGFSTDLFNNLHSYYERSGATRISIFASDDDGGWAWARTGFDWNNANDHMTRNNRSSMMNQIMTVRLDPATSAADAAAMDELLSRFAGPPAGWPSPLELTRLAGDNPRLGEQILRGSDWYGVMWL